MIRIGTINSVGDPSYFSRDYSKADRQTLEETINGVHVHDEGFVEEGVILNVTADFANNLLDQLEAYWKNREQVTIVDHRDRLWSNRRIIIKEIEDIAGMNYSTVKMEIWAK